MSITRVLIANRGEIAIRIARTCAALGLESVAVFAEDDAQALHALRAEQSEALKGAGPAAYMDIRSVIAAATRAGCDAVHPGYGFLSERADFAAACAAAGLTFVGPAPETLALFGDKARARGLAFDSGVPLLAGTHQATSPEDARAFLDAQGPGGAIMLKALAGGGGRGIRPVRSADELAGAYERCRSEAMAAFGDDALYVERFLPRARHVEVQIVGDGTGAVTHLWDRDCTLQRRHQKILEIAPAVGLDPDLRTRIHEAALSLAAHAAYRGIGTMEFLVDLERKPDAPDAFAFMEANPRLQVEHTVTEAVTGTDLVAVQLAIAAGRTLEALGLAGDGRPEPRGIAVQARLNMETMAPDGSVKPTGGTLSLFEMPSGPGIRVDSAGTAGLSPSPRYDSLLAKIITHGPDADLPGALRRAEAALSEARVAGIATNLAFLRALTGHPDIRAGRFTTLFIDDHSAALVEAANALPGSGLPEPLGDAVPQGAALTDGALPSPLQGTVVTVSVEPGTRVSRGQDLLILESMKMEHVVSAPHPGIVREVTIVAGDTVREGQGLLILETVDGADEAVAGTQEGDLDRIRPDLAEVEARHALGLDDGRADAVAKRRARGHRTARENIEDLCDPGSFLEYGALAIAAQRRRRSVDDLIANTPADGLVGGTGRINGHLFTDEAARAMVMSYDYMVLAGTQGAMNHKKTDRLLHLAEEWRMPIVLFAEGGGGRPGDTDTAAVAGLDVPTFRTFGRLSGLMPRIGIANGRCFAGNAALFGCCDVTIATRDSTIGMGGPAMIEGGGLGVFKPEEVGPIDVQTRNGVVDVAVADEAEAVAVARQYLSYFQGPVADWTCTDQRRLRHLVPENRLRVYDIRTVIETLCDEGSVLELRPLFGPGMITALVRIEGHPYGLIANNPQHLSGAIDSDGADKAARFLQLCDAFDLGVISLVDTPGIMVGPDAEKTALVRHASRLFVTAGSLTVPLYAIVTRKGYGLGAQTMTGGSFHAPTFLASWPSGEFGGMGLEGAVRLGYRRELEAETDPEAQKALYDKLIARYYAHGKAVNMASVLEIDAVIDPVESRRWITEARRALPAPPPRTGKKRPLVDTW
ncbi:MAG: carboxyl transferase domain-containing protein [Alphaproteobacteria bacterium]